MAVLGLHNLAVHRLLPAPAGAALNLATGAGLTALAGRAGCSRADLGIDAADAGRGLGVGFGAAVAAGGAVVAAAAWPATRELFGDRRHRGVGRAEATYQVAVRIPLATALAEELMFRGALLALFRRRRSTAAAVLWTSLLFGAWHARAACSPPPWPTRPSTSPPTWPDGGCWPGRGEPPAPVDGRRPG